MANFKIIEATNGPNNWGKFGVARFDEEWSRISEVGSRNLLVSCGWTYQHLLVMDFQTGEGAIFKPGGYAKADLAKHKIWVCPLYEPFLTWLYKQDLSDLAKLPDLVDLPDAEFIFQGHRRAGPSTRFVCPGCGFIGQVGVGPVQEVKDG